ncbi:MAG: hypothetical protein COZ46_07515 [Verrucomicrobia bacterium CG_4_10_14_3_um_filter_43_23]|nr:MAG: hypothetical protein AUJ82_03160 [Verrucomicrobia bacterium CG1_02_43_26]PIP59694.1 MAG: hypothetical protein COX01_01990 [Verrucomicrobia bacterium CG22_combo_CG10-13_8_21_14_all_43_17]PIX57706.1 MAG: hypothetical protein COZ46_07515 [Verrucomicrobia bacterium CG_4_10_14_3_um_filter_43_23]PIY62498.1 MAG: hypothetical protein COY94_01700 [Verrucomicrobia bacterium CG_4_10_14_0_8_um_filter_43_34]PJA44682.1 MAG: hypothetical protein CO175_01925 [Verrucomicrobia bacterium CG_4_9_14_3_um_fi
MKLIPYLKKTALCLSTFLITAIPGALLAQDTAATSPLPKMTGNLFGDISATDTAATSPVPKMTATKMAASSALATSAEPYGYIRLKPLQTSLTRAMSMIRQIYPAQQQEMVEIIPMIFFGFLGYPEFPNLSSDTNLTLFFFEDENVPNLDENPSTQHILFLVKIGKSAGEIKQKLDDMDFYYVQHNDWLLISADKPFIDSAFDFEALIAINQAPLATDLDGHFFVQKTSPLMAPDAQSKPSMIVSEDMKGKPFYALLASIYDPLDDNIDEFSFALDFAPEALMFSSSLKAMPGSPEAALFSQKTGMPFPVARYFTDDHSCVFAGQFDPSAVVTYADYLFARFEKIDNADFQTFLAAYKPLFYRFVSSAQGPFAGSVENMDSESGAVVALSGSYNDAVFLDTFSQMKENVVPNFNKAFGSHIKFDYTPNISAFYDIPVHYAVVTEQETNDAGQMSTLFERRRYIASIDGDALIANDLEPIHNLIEDMRVNFVAPNNLMAVFTPKNGVLAHYQINSNILIDTIRNNSEEVTAPANQSPKDIEKMPPIEGVVITANNTLTIKTQCPVKSLAAIYKAFDEVYNEEMEALNEDDSFEGEEVMIEAETTQQTATAPTAPAR